MSFHTQIADQVKRVPARRWIEYARIFGQPSQDCMTDAVLALLVVCNELDRQRQGLPWNAPATATLDRYMDMSLDDLEATLRGFLPDAADELSEGAAFRADGSAGSEPAGGVVADGRGTGAGTDAGADLSGDGDPAE